MDVLDLTQALTQVYLQLHLTLFGDFSRFNLQSEFHIERNPQI
jgi:hypothetical protein